MSRGMRSPRPGVPWVAIAALAVAVIGYIDLKADVMKISGQQELMLGHAPPHLAPDDLPSAIPPEAIEPPALPAQPPPTPATANPAEASAPTPPPESCSGTLTRQQVQEALGRHARDVFDCYAQRRANAPDLAGPLRLTLWVNAEGAVSHGRIDGIEDEELRRCVRGSLLSWHFAAPTGGECAVVQAPFSLSPPAN